MAEKPILFSSPMIQAIIQGRKSQTRRVIKPQPVLVGGKPGNRRPDEDGFMITRETPNGPNSLLRCPYTLGQHLWVRETFFCNSFDYPEPTEHARENLYYRADGEHTRDCEQELIKGWHPSIFMPRWASRITLQVVSVRVERVQDISVDDAQAEGVDTDNGRNCPAYCFYELWEIINGKRGYGWEANPWVWCIEFKRAEADHANP